MEMMYTYLKRNQVILHVDALTLSSSVLTGGIIEPMSSQLKVHSDDWRFNSSANRLQVAYGSSDNISL